jgi:hypothetical protein
MEISMEVSRNLKLEHQYIQHTIHNSQAKELAKVLINRYKDKENAYIHNGILFSRKKE